METKTFTFCGFLKECYEDRTSTETIELIDGDNRVDIIKKFRAINDLYESDVTVSYYISDNKITESEAQGLLVAKISGGLVAGIEYTEWSTGGFYGTTSLEVGGHDLYDELCSKHGKWVILMVNVHNSDLCDRLKESNAQLQKVLIDVREWLETEDKVRNGSHIRLIDACLNEPISDSDHENTAICPISETMDKTIDEAFAKGFVVDEFQLGSKLYEAFFKEFGSKTNQNIDAKSVVSFSYKGVRVTRHTSGCDIKVLLRY
jgi:hypothetical protein